MICHHCGVRYIEFFPNAKQQIVGFLFFCSRKERIRIVRIGREKEIRTISEEQAQKNSEVFLRLRKGMTVRLECYQAFHDVTLTGTVTGVSVPY